VFGYGLAGPHLDPDSGSDLARACQGAHEVLEGHASTAVTAAGGVPTLPAADYPALYPVRDTHSAQRLAIRLETDAAAAWRYLYAVAAEALDAPATAARTSAQAALIASAVRATRWRVLVDPDQATVAFPGI
jgi:Domain of unknown function (DUF4439)